MSVVQLAINLLVLFALVWLVSVAWTRGKTGAL